MTSALPSLSIRPATLADLDIFADFQIKMAHETENRLLKKQLITRGLKRALENKEFGAHLFVASVTASDIKEEGGDDGKKTAAEAADDKKDKKESSAPVVIACMMVTSEYDLTRAGTVLWFQSVFVSKPYRRMGCFKKFYEFVRQRAESDPNVCSIRLDVDCTNLNAQQTYKSMGMHLEGVGLARFSPVGVEPELIDGGEDEMSSKQQKEQTSTLRPLSRKIRIRPATPADAELVERVIVPLQLSNAVTYWRRRTTNDNDGQTLKDIVARGVDTVFKRGKDVGAQLFLAEEEGQGDAGEGQGDAAAGGGDGKSPSSSSSSARRLVGSVVSTCEWSDWRDGVALWIQNFAVPDELKENRPDIWRAFFRYFKKRCETDPDVSCVRFVFEADVEKSLPETVRVDEALAVEEGMFAERYFLMRWDKSLDC